MADASAATSAVTATAGSGRAARYGAALVLVLGTATNTISLLVALSTYGKPGAYASNPLGEFAQFGLAVTLLSVGYLLTTRRPDNRIGPLFLGFGALAAAAAVSWTTMLVTSLPGGDRLVGAWSAWLGASVASGAFTYLLVSIVVRFPHGDAATTTDARLLRWLPLACALVSATTALRPGPMLILPAFDNPLATPAGLHPILTFASNATMTATLVLALALGWGMYRRYRRASDVGRLQLRWFAYGAAIVAVATSLYLVAGVLLAPTNNGVRELTYAIYVLSLTSLPVAVFQAIASHRLYDIDRIIGRTFAYGALTAILAGLYAASVRLFQAIFVAVTGDESDTALVLTTLVLATTFTPIKQRLEKLAEKRFKPADERSTGSDEDAAAAAFTAAQLTVLDARIEAAVREAAGNAAKGPGTGRRSASR